MNLTPSAAIEVELWRLLQTQADHEIIIDEILKKYSDKVLSKEEVETLATFFLYSGRYIELNSLFVSFIKKQNKIPWGHFVESLFLSTPSVSDALKKSLILGAQSQNGIEDLVRSQMLDQYDQNLYLARQRRGSKFQESHILKRDEMLSQIEILHTQGLDNEEGKLIARFIKIFPDDTAIQAAIERRNKRKALGLIEEAKSFKPSWIPIEAYQEHDKATKKILRTIEASMIHYLHENPLDRESAKDFVIAQIMLDNDRSAIRFIDPRSADRSLKWLRFELLMRLRKFVDLLSEILEVEKYWLNDPDITFHLLYLRAQALWGLGQKQSAIEIMESLTITRPNYRSAMTLLMEWKEQFS